MTTIGSLAYGISANTSNFTAGIAASKSELRTLKEAFLASQSPVEKYSSAIAHLEDLAAKFPDKAAGLAGTISKMREEMDRASKPTSGLTDLLGRMPMFVDPVSASFQAFHTVTNLVGNALRTVESLVGGVSAEMGRLDEVAKKSQSLGIDPSTLIGWQRAAEDLAGVTGDTFNKAFQIVNTRIAEAASEGTGEAAKALERLGLSAGDLSKLDVSDKMLAIADAMQKIENPAERSRLATQLLGKAGMDLAPMLAAGGVEIRKLIEDEMQLSQAKFIDFQKLQEANDELSRLAKTINSIMSVMASEFSTTTGGAASDLVTAFQAATNNGETLRDVIRTTADFTAALVDQFKAAGEMSAKLAGPLTTAFNIAEKLSPRLALVIKAAEALNALSNLGGAPGETLQKQIDAREQFANRKPGQTAQAGIGLDADALDKQAKETKSAADKASAALDRQNAERAAIDKLREQFQRDEQREIIERIKQQDADAADLRKRGQELKEKLATPAEKLAEEMAKLTELRDKGAIDQATFGRGMADIRERGEEAAGLGDKANIKGGTVGAIRAGSIEALRAEHDGGGSIDEKQLKIQQEMRDFLRRIAEKDIKDAGLQNAENL